MEFLFLMLVVIVGNSLTTAYTRRCNAALRARFERQFEQIKIDSANPAFHFDGRTATIVYDDEETVRPGTRLAFARELRSISRYARNEAGEYFLILSNEPGKPFVKHVTHEMAKLVLMDRYVAAAA